MNKNVHSVVFFTFVIKISRDELASPAYVRSGKVNTVLFASSTM